MCPTERHICAIYAINTNVLPVMDISSLFIAHWRNRYEPTHTGHIILELETYILIMQHQRYNIVTPPPTFIKLRHPLR